jgi:glycosyltransferase involved in cell wall biosynthesis
MTKTVLVLMGFYLPGFKAGGPIRSIEGLVSSLNGEVQFRIVTTDRDLGDKVPYQNIATNRWLRVGSADVMYLPPGWKGFLSMIELLRSVNQDTVLYLNSFFSRRFSILPMFMSWMGLSRPRSVLLAPRGEFSPGALVLKKKRKHAYFRFTGFIGVYRRVLWHASTALEESDIRRILPKSLRIVLSEAFPGDQLIHEDDGDGMIAVAKDIHLISELGMRSRPRKFAGKLRAAFVSRISPMKNLLFALELLQDVSGDVSFDIYGPLEDAEYWNQCKRKIDSLPANVRVEYRGMIGHERVDQVFSEHDLFLFPTLGENYGHVICEALFAGCPVLISDKTPWRHLEEEGVGWDIPLTEAERFNSVLQECVDADDSQYSALAARAFEYAMKAVSDPAIVEENRALFRRAFGARTAV